MKRHYRILMQYPSGAYALLWTRQNTTLEEAKETLAKAQKGWRRNGTMKGRKIFICSPARAKRLLTYRTESGQKRVNNFPLGLK